MSLVLHYVKEPLEGSIKLTPTYWSPTFSGGLGSTYAGELDADSDCMVLATAGFMPGG